MARSAVLLALLGAVLLTFDSCAANGYGNKDESYGKESYDKESYGKENYGYGNKDESYGHGNKDGVKVLLGRWRGACYWLAGLKHPNDTNSVCTGRLTSQPYYFEYKEEHGKIIYPWHVDETKTKTDKGTFYLAAASVLGKGNYNEKTRTFRFKYDNGQEAVFRAFVDDKGYYHEEGYLTGNFAGTTIIPTAPSPLRLECNKKWFTYNCVAQREPSHY